MHKHSKELMALRQSLIDQGMEGPFKIIMHPETLCKIQADEPLDYIEPQDDGSVLWCGCRLETDFDVDKNYFFLFSIKSLEGDK